MHADFDVDVEHLAEALRRHDFIGRSGGDHATLPQQEDLGGQVRRGIEFVHRDHASQLFAGSNLREQVVKVQSMADIQEGSGLIEEQQPWTLGESTRECDSTLFSAAQLLDAPVGQAREIAPIERSVDGRAVLIAFAHPAALMWGSPHGNHLSHAKPERHGGRLRNDRDEARKRPAVEVADVPPQDAHAASARLEKAGSHSEQRGFARAIGPQQSGEVPRLDPQAHALERRVGRVRITC
jgi:hypothetical protein